jgi:hypothetical protein
MRVRFFFLVSLVPWLAIACSEDSAGTPTGATSSGTTTSSSAVGGSGGSTTSTGAGGAGGMVGSGGSPMSTGYSIRFFGNGGQDDDRVKIRLDDPNDSQPGPPADVGAEDFTIEFFMKARAQDNTNPALSCGSNFSWTESNIIIDRDRHSQSPSWGAGVAGGVAVFAVNGQNDVRTICGTTNVLDDAWHHVVVQRRRSDGLMSIYVDGQLDVSADGPDGDVSYPDDGQPLNVCPGGLCDYSDPFLVIGAEKHGYGGISYNGLVDEMRISKSLRYSSGFSVPTAPFSTDADTVGLYHFDETAGTTANDSSGAPGGPSHGILNVGGSPMGPVWTQDSPFL